MYVTEPILKQNVKMISIRNLTTYNLTSKVMNYYLDFFSFRFSQLWKKIRQNSKNLTILGHIVWQGRILTTVY